MRAFLDRLGIAKCYLGGGSLGGYLTLSLAHDSPERFPKVVAWAPAGSWTAHPVIGRLGHAIGGYATFWPIVKAQSSYWYSPEFPGRDAIAPEIRQPVLLVWGDRDDGGGMADGVARMHELLPDSRLVVFQGARHSLADERPAELSREIVRFLSK